MIDFISKVLLVREAQWSSGERHGLTIQTMVLGCGFESRLHLMTRWKDGPLDGRKITKIIQAAKWGKSHQKYLKKYWL